MTEMLDQATIERVAAAIDSADIGYSMRQVRLVDGVNTYSLKIDGETTEFTDNDEATATEQVYARIREVKQRAQAEAVIAAIGKESEGLSRMRDALRPFADVADLFDSEAEGFSMDDQLQLIVKNEGFPEYHVNSFSLQRFYDARSSLTKEKQQ